MKTQKLGCFKSNKLGYLISDRKHISYVTSKILRHERVKNEKTEEAKDLIHQQ
jgi:hypothetical protein